jgi:membrane-associated protein
MGLRCARRLVRRAFTLFRPVRPFAFEESHLDTLLHFVNLVLHIDAFLGDFIRQYGAWVYRCCS